MNEKLQVVMHTFKTNMYLVEKALEGLSDDEFSTRPSDNNNSLQFILGHLIGSRAQLLSFGNKKFEREYFAYIGRGVETPSSEQLPNLQGMVADWQAVSKEMFEMLAQMTDEQLSAKYDGNLPFEDNSVLGAIAFLGFHETYHTGQMSYIRRFLGHSQVVG